MMLSSQNLIHYLLGRGLIEPAAVVQGNMTIAEIPRRHRNFKVLQHRGSGLFVKQAKDQDLVKKECLRREGACCRLASEDPAFASLRRHMPGFRDFDEAGGTLVVELFTESESLADLHQRTGDYPPEIGEELGRRLGELHAPNREDLGSPPYSQIFPARLPPILNLHHSPAGFAAIGPAAAELTALLCSDVTIRQSLDCLIANWRREALVHGDVKCDNCLRVNGEVRLVDWELADYGDPAWDAGAVFQTYLAQWIWSMPALPAPAAALVGQAKAPLPALRPILRSFWSSYVEARGLPSGSERGELFRCLRYGAARMLQTAFEMVAFEGRLTPHALLLAQLARNILLRPRTAARQLLEM